MRRILTFPKEPRIQCADIHFMRAATSWFAFLARRANPSGAGMIDESARSRRTPSFGLVRAAVAATVLLAGLQACSSVPDAANPIEWYKGARDWVTGDDSNEKAKEAEAEAPVIPGEDKPFPSVSSVPEAPKTRAPRSGRRQRSR